MTQGLYQTPEGVRPYSYFCLKALKHGI